MSEIFAGEGNEQECISRKIHVKRTTYLGCTAFVITTKSLIDELCTEEGATNANGNNISEGLSSHTNPLAITNELGKLGNLFANLQNLRNNVFAIKLVLVLLGGTQSHMEHGAILSGVDVGTRGHGVHAIGELALLCKLEQEPHRLSGHALAGKVQENVVILCHKRSITRRVCKEITKVCSLDIFGIMRF